MNIPKQKDALYYDEVREIIILTAKNATGAGRSGNQDFWTASTRLLASYDVKTGEIYKNGSVSWVITDDELQSYTYAKRFNDLSIYRIYARRNKNIDNIYYIIDVIEQNITFEPLEEILTEYKREVKISDDVLGELILNKDFEAFESSIKWCGNDVNISIKVDINNESDWNDIISTAADIVKNQQKWDSIIRKYAAEKLTELANDWAYDAYDEEDEESEEPPEITEQEFAERIELSDISIYKNGKFTFWFYDDDMFWGHSITVEGNIQNGCSDANIEG